MSFFRPLVFYPYLLIKKASPALAFRMKKVASSKHPFFRHLKKNWIGEISDPYQSGLPPHIMKQNDEWVSREVMGWTDAAFSHSLHSSRVRWVKSLPKADTILDLGGAAKGFELGAMILMGYPYEFKDLIIVDLPLGERHAIYREGYKLIDKPLSHRSGKVSYCYASLHSLENIPDSSIDLVNSGQSIEHIREDECERMLSECMRVLKPGGILCVDTPNGRATRVQQASFIDPDHKVEYTHAQLSKKLINAGFKIRESKGLNWMPQSIRQGIFDSSEVTRNFGVYDDIENCYLLAYRCEKPL